MDKTLVFYGPWTIEVTSLQLRMATVQLIVNEAGAADGMHLNPPVGTQLAADGPEWSLRVEVSIDLQPYQAQELVRDFQFDSQLGMTVIVRVGPENLALGASMVLRLVAQDPELRTNPLPHYDFTIPEGIG
jgi:hypothetical protein